MGRMTRFRIPDSLHASSSAWTALAFMMVVYFFSYFQRAAIPGTVFNEIQTDLGLSATAVAGLGSLFLGIYAGTQLFIGMGVDRFGGRRTLLWGTLLMVVGAIWFPLTRTMPALYAVRALTGFGASFMYLSIVHEVELLFGARRFPAVMGIVLFVGYAGGIAGSLPFAVLVSWTGWREALLGIGLFMALFGVAAWLVLRRLPPGDHKPVTISFRPLWQVLFSLRNLPILLFALASFSIFFVVQNVVGKKFLQDAASLSSNQAALFVLIMASVSAATCCLSGFWLKLSRQRRKPVLVTFACILLGGIVLLTWAVAVKAPPACLLFAYILIAASVGSGPAGATVIKELNRQDCVAQSVAVLNGVTYAGVSLLAALSGWILDRYAAGSVLTPVGRLYPSRAYLVLFAVMAGVALFSLACLSFVRETGTFEKGDGDGRHI
jgi:predicted MFS family arabinose efflux permease